MRHYTWEEVKALEDGADELADVIKKLQDEVSALEITIEELKRGRPAEDEYHPEPI